MIDHTHDDPVDIDAGFEVAPGDDVDVQVVNEHGWQSGGMVFSDGGFAWTALDIAEEIEMAKTPGYVCYCHDYKAVKGMAFSFVR
jgi:hypothetical protein